ncbi:MAG TPA: hypothetical protein VFH45_02560 [Acidimicrobiales bacterium]|nr:hypothetical protein [Acidimicrobiales bacterium]
MNLYFWLGVPVAVASAARSTYSPCGLSMLSSITPFGERGRGHRYYATAAWYVIGAVVGGLTLGGAAAILSFVAAGAGRAGLWVAGPACLLAALVDGGAFGPVLPLLRRQVDDRWLARYRPWAYAAGFGWQIGVGVATYLMTTGVLVVAALGVLSGRVEVALSLGALFGLARGLTVFATAPASTPARLRAVHARIDRMGAAVRAATIAVLAGAALVAVLAAGGTVGLAPARWWASAAGALAAAAAIATTAVARAARARAPRSRAATARAARAPTSRATAAPAATTTVPATLQAHPGGEPPAGSRMIPSR